MTHPAMPRAAFAFVEFATVLRRNGFAVAPEQTTAFLSAIDLLGPKGMDDIYRAARATLAPPFERRGEFEALFRAFFMGQTLAAPAIGEEDEEMRVRDAETGQFEPELSDEQHETGEQATAVERLTQRGFDEAATSDVLRRFARAAREGLPQRRVRRYTGARAGDRFDLRQALREAVRNDGDVMRLPRRTRKLRQRPVLLLVDVSGSMKEQTDDHLRLAHVLVQTAERAEVFTLGTRLTRITRALKLKREDEALAVASNLVADWDGGTRIGDALGAFMQVPRYVGLARGAVVIVLSDGLERGDHAAMVDAVAKLSRCVFELHWLSPLATSGTFEPATAALEAAAPWIDSFGDGSSLERICTHILDMPQGRAA